MTNKPQRRTQEANPKRVKRPVTYLVRRNMSPTLYEFKNGRALQYRNAFPWLRTLKETVGGAQQPQMFAHGSNQLPSERNAVLLRTVCTAFRFTLSSRENSCENRAGYAFEIKTDRSVAGKQQTNGTNARDIHMTLLTYKSHAFSNEIWLCNSNCWGSIRGGIRTMLRIGLFVTLHPSKGRARALWGAPIDVQKIKKIRAARRFGALQGALERSGFPGRKTCRFSVMTA
jgi:hypothetical protein